jgi:hypothetical protein
MIDTSTIPACFSLVTFLWKKEKLNADEIVCRRCNITSGLHARGLPETGI